MKNKEYHKNQRPLLPELSFRTAFVFALLLAVPVTARFYRYIFETNWLEISYNKINRLSNYYPWFVGGDGKDYAGLIIAFGISALLAIGWYVLDKRQLSKTEYYYWFCVIVRYKLVMVMLYFGLVKLFPIQMPFPTESWLNTKIGDVTPGKLYWITTGASTPFQIFSGLFETIGAVLLLFRRTVVLGACLLLTIMVTVVMINIGYDAGVQMKSIVITLLVLFLLTRHMNRILRFLLYETNINLNKTITPDRKWFKRYRIVLKLLFILVFLVIRGWDVSYNYFAGKTYKLPDTPFLTSVSGFYNVEEFKLNGKVLPYSPVDSNRWRDVVFENWGTLSINIPRSIEINNENRYRTTEFFSNAGREFYQYQADSTTKTLILERMGRPTQKFVLGYEIHGNDLLLSGITDQQDSIHLTLTKIPRKYALKEKDGIFVPY